MRDAAWFLIGVFATLGAELGVVIRDILRARTRREA